MKYTQDEIERIMNERVQMVMHQPTFKEGLICEWSFTYPTGMKTVEVEYAFPMDGEEHDWCIANDIILQKIEKKVWEICGKYTLGTGDKL